MAKVTDFNELLFTLVDAGFDITLRKGNGRLKYEINTGAKSNLTIYENSYDLCYFESRYSEGNCADYSDFLQELKYCLCGRDYANTVFFDFLEKEGLIEKVIETKVRYKL